MISSILFLIIVALLVLSILILSHELGHFIIARRAGVWVEEFGLGLPPRLFGKKIGETIYSINLFPLGGFVRLHGETTEEGLNRPKQAFLNKSKKARAIITSGGIVANFLLAIVGFSLVYSFSGVPRETKEVKVVEVVAGSPAQTAKILVGDIVRKVGQQEITSVDNFKEIIKKNKGKRISLEVERSRGDEKTFEKISLIPRESPPEKEGPLGVIITSTEIYYPPVWQRPFVGVYYGFKEALFWTKTVILGLAGIFSTVSRGQAPEGVAGPVGIAALIAYVAKLGILPLINLTGIISVNLAILNLVPFPPLDGSRLLSIGIESIFGRRTLPRVEAIIHTVGMIILLMLILAITAQDIQRLISAGGISGFVDSILR